MRKCLNSESFIERLLSEELKTASKTSEGFPAEDGSEINEIYKEASEWGLIQGSFVPPGLTVILRSNAKINPLTLVRGLLPLRNDNWDIPSIWVKAFILHSNHGLPNGILTAFRGWRHVGIPTYIDKHFETLWNTERTGPCRVNAVHG
jgi:hypothetical protein